MGSSSLATCLGLLQSENDLVCQVPPNDPLIVLQTTTTPADVLTAQDDRVEPMKFSVTNN